MVDTAFPRSFAPFLLLPLEIRRQIWSLAVLASHEEIIPLFLSDPTLPASYRGNQFFPWKHLFSPRRRTSILSLVCTESRDVVFGTFARGLLVEYRDWSASDQPLPAGPTYQHTQCIHEVEAFNFNKNLLWCPETDFVHLQFGSEQYGCDSTSRCNAFDAAYRFSLDERLQYLVMDLKIWEAGKYCHDIVAEGLKVVFIIADGDAIVQEFKRRWEEEQVLGVDIEDTLASLNRRLIDQRKHELLDHIFGPERSLAIKIKVVRHLNDVHNEIEIFARSEREMKQNLLHSLRTFIEG